MNYIKTNWNLVLEKCFDFNKIEKFLNKERELLGNEIKIFPPKELIYNCFNFFNFEDTKVVILGQDPYINENQAMGLAFSVPNESKIPPSLRNIFKILDKDLNIKNINNNLEPWAKQGILLLNCSLTVRQYKSNSHKKFWEEYTNNLIKYISDNSKKIIFVLWGKDAQKKKKLINNKHLILESSHPSPLSFYKGFNNCNHFNIINKNLEQKINWNT